MAEAAMIVVAAPRIDRTTMIDHGLAIMIMIRNIGARGKLVTHNCGHSHSQQEANS
jgi:hypothetical protein